MLKCYFLFQEEDILDMIAQCEAEEAEGKTITTNKLPRGPKVYSHITVFSILLFGAFSSYLV